MNDEIEVIRGSVIEMNDPDAVAINENHRLFSDSCETAFEYAISCGLLLIAKKDKMRHGDWELWVGLNCDFKIRAAQKYMSVASKAHDGAFIKNPKSIRAALAAYNPPEPKEKEDKPFDWATDTRIKKAVTGLQDLRIAVSILRASDRDASGAEYYLSMFKKAFEKMLADLKDY